MRVATEVPATFHGAQVIKHGREWHPHAVSHFRGGQGPLLKKKAVDGVLIGSQRHVRQRQREQAANALIEHE